MTLLAPGSQTEHLINLKGFVFHFNEVLDRFSFPYKTALKAVTDFVSRGERGCTDISKNHRCARDLKRSLQLAVFLTKTIVCVFYRLRVSDVLMNSIIF